MWRSRRPPPAGLAELVSACEAGRDLRAILEIAARAVEAALGAKAAAAYTLSDDAAALVLVCGAGPGQLPGTVGLDPVAAAGEVRLPLVSARRVLGCIVARGGRDDGLAEARMIAGVAAQAVESARLWESAGAGAGALDLLTQLPN